MSKKDNNNVDRFQFVTMDELDNSLDDVISSSKEDTIEDSFKSDDYVSINHSDDDHSDVEFTAHEESNVSEEEVISDSENSNFEENVVPKDFTFEREKNDSEENFLDDDDSSSSDKEEIDNSSSNELKEDSKDRNVATKKHLSFEVRIAIMIICTLCMFIGACLLILETVRNSEQEVVTFREFSSAQYNVCLSANQQYNTSCLTEDLTYDSTIVDTINAHFRYDVNFSSDISYNMYYHVDAVTRIYDKNDVNKVLYTSTDTLKKKVALGDISNSISFETDVILDYQKYNTGAVFYQKRYFLNSNANVEIILYLDEPNNSRRIGSLIVPLGTPEFEIQKNVVSNTNGSVAVDGNFWNRYNAICALIASILIIIALFLLYRTTLLVLRVTSNRSEYQQRLESILREYDRIIVIARDGYESNYVKEIVKLDTFEDLLDVRNELLKPIIYSRINEVKSEFLVEDDEKLYKYVLKESDL